MEASIKLPLLIAFDSSGSGVSQGSVLVGRIKASLSADQFLIVEPLVFCRMLMPDPSSPGKALIVPQVMSESLFPHEREQEINVNVGNYKFWKIIREDHPKYEMYETYYEKNLANCFARAAGLEVATDYQKPKLV